MTNPLKPILIGIACCFAFIAILIMSGNDKPSPLYGPSKKYSNIEDLKKWADKEIIQDFCGRYATAKSFGNETKRATELHYVENSRNNIIPLKVAGIIEDNNLSDAYKSQLSEYIDSD